MTPEQRTRLDAVERRGYIGCDGQAMVNTMRRIDERKTRAAAVYRKSFRAARCARVMELYLACALIALCLAAAFFLA